MWKNKIEKLKKKLDITTKSYGRDKKLGGDYYARKNL